MAECTTCKAQITLYEHGVPTCLNCVQKREAKLKRLTKSSVLAVLTGQLLEDTVRAEIAREAFAAITGEIPSGLPPPDGVQRIHNASNNLTAARDQMMRTHTRLNDFIEHGIVPEDLKRSG